MAAGVVTQDAEGFREFADLRIPHGKVGAKRIRKDEGGVAGRAFESVVNLRVMRIDEGHGKSVTSRVLKRERAHKTPGAAQRRQNRRIGLSKTRRRRAGCVSYGSFLKSSLVSSRGSERSAFSKT